MALGSLTLMATVCGTRATCGATLELAATGQSQATGADISFSTIIFVDARNFEGC